METLKLFSDPNKPPEYNTATLEDVQGTVKAFEIVQQSITGHKTYLHASQ
ncbi:MAG TPA: hypothetical protein VNE41_12685 [Chitinophagaceae bacterium]|nr:hypothetical protein [Chitinophagaceae bacterium]